MAAKSLSRGATAATEEHARLCPALLTWLVLEDEVPDGPSGIRVHTSCGLIQDNSPRPAHKGNGHRQLPLHAARESLHLAVPFVGEFQVLNHPGDRAEAPGMLGGLYWYLWGVCNASSPHGICGLWLLGLPSCSQAMSIFCSLPQPDTPRVGKHLVELLHVTPLPPDLPPGTASRKETPSC